MPVVVMWLTRLCKANIGSALDHGAHNDGASDSLRDCLDSPLIGCPASPGRRLARH